MGGQVEAPELTGRLRHVPAFIAPLLGILLVLITAFIAVGAVLS